MIKRILCVLMASVLMICTTPFVLAEGADNIPDGIPSLDPYYTDEYIIYPCESTDRASCIIDQTVSISSNTVGKSATDIATVFINSIISGYIGAW